MLNASIVTIVIASMVVSAPLAQAGFFSFLFGKSEASEVAIAEHGSNSQTMNVLEAVSSSDMDAVGGPEISIEDDALVPETGPLGTAADVAEAPSSDQISIYIVHEGDTVEKVAKMYEVSPNTILWANNIKKGTALKVGATLVILPITGIKHTVVKGDTVATIAKKYGGDAQEIGFFNAINEGDSLTVGATIIVPDGEVTAIAPTPKPKAKYTINPVTKKRELIKGTGGPSLNGYFIRPINGGRLSQGLHGNNGIDLAAPMGTPIYAAASGTVIISNTSGWGGGYGKYIVIKHDNGTQTLYAHNTQNLASVGDRVEQGQQIAKLGSTGRSTGPHVHFEVRGAKNPGSNNAWK